MAHSSWATKRAVASKRAGPSATTSHHRPVEEAAMIRVWVGVKSGKGFHWGVVLNPMARSCSCSGWRTPRPISRPHQRDALLRARNRLDHSPSGGATLLLAFEIAGLPTASEPFLAPPHREDGVSRAAVSPRKIGEVYVGLDDWLPICIRSIRLFLRTRTLAGATYSSQP
jgi:hypothetical protein